MLSDSSAWLWLDGSPMKHQHWGIGSSFADTTIKASLAPSRVASAWRSIATTEPDLPKIATRKNIYLRINWDYSCHDCKAYVVLNRLSFWAITQCDQSWVYHKSPNYEHGYCYKVPGFNITRWSVAQRLESLSASYGCPIRSIEFNSLFHSLKWKEQIRRRWTKLSQWPSAKIWVTQYIRMSSDFIKEALMSTFGLMGLLLTSAAGILASQMVVRYVKLKI